MAEKREIYKSLKVYAGVWGRLQSAKDSLRKLEFPWKCYTSSEVIERALKIAEANNWGLPKRKADRKKGARR